MMTMVPKLKLMLMLMLTLMLVLKLKWSLKQLAIQQTLSWKAMIVEMTDQSLLLLLNFDLPWGNQYSVMQSPSCHEDGLVQAEAEAETESETEVGLDFHW